MLAGLIPCLATALVVASTPSSEDPPVLIRAARVILRPGEELTNATLWIEDGVIVAIGTDLPAPEGARVIEGQVVCAGFIDAWSSLGLDPESAEDGNLTPGARTVDALDPYHLAEERQEALRAGVTATRVQAGRTASIGGVGALVQTDAGFESPVVLADACLASTIGLTRGRAADVFDRLGEIDRLIGALDKGRKYKESRAQFEKDLEKWLKTIGEKLVELEKDFKKAKKDREKEEKEAKEKGKEFKEKSYKEDKKPRRVKVDVNDEALGRAADGELPLVVEVHRAAEIRRLLEKTRTFPRLRLVLAGGTEAAGFAEELAERGIPVILWPVPMGTVRPDEYDEHDLALAGELARAGVKVAIGNGGTRDARELRNLAALAVAHGLDRDAALAAVTSVPAELFDAAERLGALAPGHSADVLVLDGDPLDTTAQIRFVIARGKVVVP